MPIVKDPVCQRELDTDAIDAHVSSSSSGAPETDPSRGTKRFHEGEWYYFHSLDCRMKFISAPERYLGDE